MRKPLCKILTRGKHWWGYYPELQPRRTVRCRICGKYAPLQWSALQSLPEKYIERKNKRRHEEEKKRCEQ